MAADFVGGVDPVVEDFVEEDLVGVREELRTIFRSDLDGVFLDRKVYRDNVYPDWVCHFSIRMAADCVGEADRVVEDSVEVDLVG